MNNNFEKTNFLAKWQDDRFFAKYSFNHMQRFRPEPVGCNSLSACGEDIPNWEDFERYGMTAVDTFQERPQLVDEHNAALGWRERFGDLTLGLTGTFMDSSKRYRNLSIARLPPHQQWGIGRVWMDYHTRRYGIAGDAAYELDMDNFNHRFEFHAKHLWETLAVSS